MAPSLITNYFKTSDIWIITSLVYAWYKLDSIDKTNNDRVIFYIERDENIDDIIQAYFSFELKVEPVRFLAIQKSLKNRIYN